MTRREALKAAAALVSGLLAAAGGVLTGCTAERRTAGSRILTLEDQELLEEIADTFLPPTDASPGARSAGVGATIVLVLTECQGPDVQQRVASGLREFRAMSRDRAGSDFPSLARPERERLLREIDAAAVQSGESHWFGITRELALHAYFTSELGLTQAMRYVMNPGRWEGCVPLAPGQPTWG